MVDVLEQLRSRVDALLQRYTAVRAENERLREQVAGHERTIHLLQGRIEALTQGALDRQLAKALPAGEKEPLRQHLDSVISDIDKILASLHA